MPLSVQCPECGTPYNVPDKLAGKRAKCKKCAATMSIPAPEVEVGFAPEEDPLAALQDLARESGDAEAPSLAPAPARKRAAGIPADWTPESVIVEKESSSSRSRQMEGSGRWAPKSGGGGLVRKLLVLGVVAALAAGGWYVYQNYADNAADLIASAKNKVKGGAKTSPDGSTETPKQPAAAPTDTERKRTESAEHLRRIHAAVIAHFARANRTWPVDLAALQRDGSLDGQQLVSPFGPAFASGDYVYKPYAPETPAGAEVVLAYDNAEFSNGEGANVLFGTGEVRWLDRAAVEAVLQQSEALRVAAVQQHEQQVSLRTQQAGQPRTPSTMLDPGTNPGSNNVAGSDNRRGPGRGDVAARIKAGAQGFVGEVLDAAVRRGTDQLIRPMTPASAVAVLVRGTQGDTIEVLDGKTAEPVQVAEFATDPQFRTNAGAYALSPDGSLLARLTAFPKLRAVVHSFDKKAEVQAIDLEEKFGEPTLVGFLSPDKFVIRWQSRGEHGFEVWDAKTGKRGRQVPLFRVDPAPSPGSEAVSADGRTYAIVNRIPPTAAPRGRPAADPGLQVLLYDVLAGPTQPRRFPVPVLNNQPGVSAAGLAFSPDKQRLALLLLDPQGRAVVVTWNFATGKPLPERALAEKIDAPRIGLGRARSLDWVADGRALLVAGRLIMNPDTGETLAVLDAGKVHGQAVTNDSTVHLAHGDFGSLEGVAVVPLNEAKFPEKPGLPNRATAAPAR